MYSNGRGVGKDEEKAFYWCAKAANQGYPSAQYTTAYYYSNGIGVKRDYERAVKWYREAMANGHSLAYNNMAYMYVDGKGVEKSMEMAFEMVNKAIELEPDEANYYDTKGELYSMIGDKEKAFEMWQKILSLDPDFEKRDTPFVQYIKKNIK